MAKGGRCSGGREREVLEMRSAETVLAAIRDRGSRGLPVEDVYRQLYNPELYLRAYGKIYGNKGAMTPGTTAETVDGMSKRKIGETIELLRNERYRWTPVRRTHIPKGNGKTRPLGIPTWSDKLLQEVIREILEAYYEPQFSPYSHGFRPNRGCHTALVEIEHVWKGTKWFVEGDIKGCFDNIDHRVLLSILREKVQDNRFVRLIDGLLKAGYMEDWKYNRTLSGTPQGGIVSPILANIYLDKLDKYVEQVLIPEYNRGQSRRWNLEYRRIASVVWRARKTGRSERIREGRKRLARLPSRDPLDPGYRRLRYIRYADDFLLGFAGPKVGAEEIKASIRDYLQTELGLQLSGEKTLITHATTEAARFLGYEISVQRADDLWTTDSKGRKGRHVNGKVRLGIPRDVIEARCRRHMRNGKPIHRPELIDSSDYDIVRGYQQVYRGIVGYYALAHNLGRLAKLRWVTETSLGKTLAAKHKLSLQRVFDRYKTSARLPEGTYKVVEVRVPREGKPPLVTRFGGIPLRRKPNTTIADREPLAFTGSRSNDLLTRLLAEECELCGSWEDIEVHHVRKLADIARKGGRERPEWVRWMVARRRKTLIVCRACHEAIHAGRPTRHTERNTGEPDDAKVSSPVRRGADGKVA